VGSCSGASPINHDCSATVELMFGAPSGTRRVPATPIPVLLTLDELWPRETITIRGVTLGVRAFGLRDDGVTPGLLVAWERSSGGSWLGVCVSCTVPTDECTATCCSWCRRRQSGGAKTTRALPPWSLRPRRRGESPTDPVADARRGCRSPPLRLRCERPLRPTIEAWRSLEGERFDTKGAVAVLNRVRGQRVRDAWEARPHPPRTTRARPGWAIAGAVAVFLIAYGPQAVSVFMLYLSPAASADRASASTTMIHDAIGGQLAQLYVNSVRNNSAELLTRRPWS